jgi:hypothetical protein
MKAMLKPCTIMALSMSLLMGGCASNPDGGAQNQAAPTKGQGAAVTVIGDVSHKVIPWEDGLTLMRAYAMSGYRGFIPPSQLGIVRKKEMPMYMDFQKLDGGQDMLLEPGDTIEIRP